MNLAVEFTPNSRTVDVLAHFDGLKRQFLENGQIDHQSKFALVLHARMMSSNTLQRKTAYDLANWNLAQQMIMMSLSKNWDWNFIVELNSLLTGYPVNACERDSDIYAGGVAFVENEQKNILLNTFKNDILPNLGNYHPLISSTILRYWLVTLHPFLDGNGRTAQTLSDAWLIKFNFPPLVFKNAFQGQFAAMPEVRDDFSFEDALQSTFAGMSNSFSLLSL